MNLPESIKSRFAFLIAIAASGAATLVFVTQSGQETDDPAQVQRVCNLPGNVPASILTALAIPIPTQPDGTGVGRCLPPDQAEDGYRKLRVLAAIAEKWRAANVTSTQCAAGIVAVEFGIPSLGVDPHTEPLIQVCGPAPTVADTADIERLERLPNTDVTLRWVTPSKYARNSEPAIRLWTQGNYPAAAANLLGCACCARGQACTVVGLPLPDGGTFTGAGSQNAQYCPASRVSGTGKRLVAEGTWVATAQAQNDPSYNLDSACR